MELQRIERQVVELVANLNLRPTLDRAADLGELLTAAKTQVVHGEWGGWLKKCGLNARTANDYMAVFAHIGNQRQATGLTIRGFLGQIRKAKYKARKDQREAVREELRASLGELPGIRLEWSDCRSFDWPEAPNIIVADPPWADMDSYRWLGLWAKERLLAGGLLLVQCGTGYLAEVLAILGAAGLVYRWTLSIVYSEARTISANGPFRSVWKPVLVFTVGDYQIPGTVADVQTIHKVLRKTHHDWEQPVAPWVYWLSRLVLPGRVVLDPFAGSATIGEACHILGLQYVGTEVEEVYQVARGRLAGLTGQPSAI